MHSDVIWAGVTDICFSKLKQEFHLAEFDARLIKSVWTPLSIESGEFTIKELAATVGLGVAFLVRPARDCARSSHSDRRLGVDARSMQVGICTTMKMQQAAH